jgi:MinD superfamily P-loop ATPase
MSVKELVVISGKGGTGKTSIMASLAALSRNGVLADCDVDASDLHLLLGRDIKERHDFKSSHKAMIRADACTGCGICYERCRSEAIAVDSRVVYRKVYEIDQLACEGCGVCVWSCPVKAIDFNLCHDGEWFISETRFGPMVHARLEPGGENSGKLVSVVRKEARKIAEKNGHDFILTDGPPGTGCAVIAAISGADTALIITEPTMSGAHDMERVLELTRYFDVPTMVCVNKWDLNPDMTGKIEQLAERVGSRVAGRIRYDCSVTSAQIKAQTVIETGAEAADDIKRIWENLNFNQV